ncbi:hypothetical protein [Ectobacillus sp. sgz5001026]|uniref:hypothetical protein n=1 Tax=Ectobacillus sp. sgz5001026 TaxID=3242473 RepID=UPI0036D3C7E4
MNKKMTKGISTVMALAVPMVAILGITTVNPTESHAATGSANTKSYSTYGQYINQSPNPTWTVNKPTSQPATSQPATGSANTQSYSTYGYINQSPNQTSHHTATGSANTKSYSTNGQSSNQSPNPTGTVNKPTSQPATGSANTKSYSTNGQSSNQSPNQTGTVNKPTSQPATGATNSQSYTTNVVEDFAQSPKPTSQSAIPNTQSYSPNQTSSYHALRGKFIQKNGQVYFLSYMNGYQLVVHGSNGLNDDSAFLSASQTGAIYKVQGYGDASKIIITKLEKL